MTTRFRWLELLAVLLILILAAYLRLANAADNPAWYTDEGTHLDIARRVLLGQVQYLAIQQSWLLFSRLPLFEIILSGAAWLGGVSVWTLRLLTGLLGVSTVGMLYLSVRRATRDAWLACLAALLLAIYPSAVLYSRFGFSYNLLSPLVLFTFLAAAEYSKDRSRRWLAAASFSIGLGMLSDLWMFAMLVPFALIVLVRSRRDALWSVLLALLPAGIYAAFTLVTTPQVFLFDARFVLSRVNQLPLDRQAATVWQNITTLAAQDTWLLAGAIGLALLLPPRVRWIALAFFVLPMMLLGRTTALFSLSFYYLIPLLPFAALGVAALIRYCLSGLSNRFGRQVPAALAVIAAVPFLFSTIQLVGQVRGGFRTNIDSFLLDPIAAQEAAAFVNRRAASSDLVIASPTLAWLLRSNVADMQMPSAYRGQATPHLPGDIPPERWAFDPSLEQARFVIVDNLWRNWAVPNVPGVSEMLREVEAWPLVFRSSEIEIYQNPED